MMHLIDRILCFSIVKLILRPAAIVQLSCVFVDSVSRILCHQKSNLMSVIILLFLICLVVKESRCFNRFCEYEKRKRFNVMFTSIGRETKQGKCYVLKFSLFSGDGGFQSEDLLLHVFPD